MKLAQAFLANLVLAGTAIAAPAGSSVASAPAANPTFPYAQEIPNHVLWSPSADIDPQPVRGGLGASPVLGPQNVPVDLQNPDLLAPPSTDAGSV